MCAKLVNVHVYLAHVCNLKVTRRREAFLDPQNQTVQSDSKVLGSMRLHVGHVSQEISLYWQLWKIGGSSKGSNGVGLIYLKHPLSCDL